LPSSSVPSNDATQASHGSSVSAPSSFSAPSNDATQASRGSSVSTSSSFGASSFSAPSNDATQALPHYQPFNHSSFSSAPSNAASYYHSSFASAPLNDATQVSRYRPVDRSDRPPRNTSVRPAVRLPRPYHRNTGDRHYGHVGKKKNRNITKNPYGR
jgi:hypothetical protein